MYAFVSGYLEDEALRRVFSFQPLLVGSNPLHTTSIYSLIQHLERKDGVHFAMGGTTALVQALGRLCRERGVRIHLNRRVEEVLVDSAGSACGVRLADDTREEAS